MSLLVSALVLGLLGQTGRMFPTVEAIVGNPNSVYVGEIRRIEFTTRPERPHRKRARFFVRVRETLKGPRMGELEVECWPSIPEKELLKFVEKRLAFLWVSAPPDASLRQNLASKMAADHVSPLDFYWFRLFELGSIDRYVDYDSNLFLADFRVISRGEDFLREVRRAAKKYPKSVALTSFPMPDAVTRMCGDPNAYGLLVVPKDESLRKLAKRLALDPEAAIRDARRQSRSVYREPKLTPEDVSHLKDLGARILRDWDELPPGSLDGAGVRIR